MSLKLHKHGLIKRRDWFRVLGELDAAGLSNARVADLLGVAKNTVYGWKMGSDPTHALGETLLALHASRCGARKGQGSGADKPDDADAARTGPAIHVSGGAAADGADGAPVQGGASTGPRAVLRRAGRRGGMH